LSVYKFCRVFLGSTWHWTPKCGQGYSEGNQI
jgi:hypothetical protein